MKITLEIPDELLRRAKVQAAKHGIPLWQFIAQGVEEQLKRLS